MLRKRFVSGIAFFGVETLFFVLIFLFLILEKTVPILMILAAIIGLSLIGSRPRVRGVLDEGFARHKFWAIGYGLVFILVLPLFLKNHPYQIFILFNAGLFALLGLGLNWQIGSTNIVNFATGASFATGAYTAALLAVNTGWSFWILLPLSGSAAAAVGFVLGLPCMKTKTYYLSLVTMAFTIIVYLLLNNLEFTGGPDGISGIPYPQIGSYSFGNPIRILGMEIPFQANFYYLVVVLVAVTFLFDRRLRYSRLGLSWNAIRNDEIAAACQGIDVTYAKVLSFCANFFFDGISGAVFAFSMSHISPESFSFNVSVTVVAIVIVGGMDNAAGVILGALLMTILPEKFQIFQDYRMWIFGFIILLMLGLRPKGLLPQTVRKY
ncbi:MAG: branched-chain amino acid ABC transporter permease [Syntrophaceae bacterium]|nr:branched-chain amino acid ABC transporter permease [Syntrophaceae bacterium]